MNLSGESVAACARFYKIPLSHILVISDDIDMIFGKVRYRGEGSAGGHNGLSSIIQMLGSPQFARIKIGIDRHPEMPTADWVLSRFTTGEQETLETIFPEVEQKMLEFL
jgi:peptidyl-tRNA hydrolase, PTH1 family